ncbi:hypothetical protein Zmor_006136 [Zophobas morio]|uniref:PiggyBac transposable element-derived protein domain-containing protein n=1 Tax=Zophobas morio TaxID=2755281 RepID=A0AA38IWX5_9CUCU|nr:hypothetical protein Zmor_006136 [Zophobas morio]
MNTRTSLPFNLVGMTEDEFFEEVESSYIECTSIPSDIDSDNDSDAEEEIDEVIADNNEYVLSATDEEDDNWDEEDLIPLSRFANSTNLTYISWGKNLTNIQPPPPFTEPCGLPQFILDVAEPTPFDFFNLLVTDDILGHLVFQTNLYAEQEFQSTGKTCKKLI